MWGKKADSKKTDVKKVHTHFDTLISSQTSIKGNMNFSGGLHIDGKVNGTIKAENLEDAVVRISDVGEVDGDVIAPHIIVNGTVHGDVYAARHIELAAKASIKGNVYYHLIEMAMGAEVNGNLVHLKDPEQVLSKQDTAQVFTGKAHSESSKKLSSGEDVSKNNGNVPASAVREKAMSGKLAGGTEKSVLDKTADKAAFEKGSVASPKKSELASH
ncbi:cell shape determination protein CcmA [Oleiphilus messinensis]|uniref:Cell shape determination protein CcmA n=1 Tax=Oleiphilus messinensis TaxID=141451 RepID=A0A1Y0IH58_9GAMM|nr:polymer-forming cytoskeletal protein [Oleiphilus messinensis]ARU58724.1 cell shape determination protein CcmA [Oleiphilus messinensis]